MISGKTFRVIVFGLFVGYLVNRFVFNRFDTVSTGKPMKQKLYVSSDPLELVPLDRFVDCAAIEALAEKDQASCEVGLSTAMVDYKFCSDDAALASLEIKQVNDLQGFPVKSFVRNLADDAKAVGAFSLLCGKELLVGHQLIDFVNAAGKRKVVFRTKHAGWFINKTLTFDDNYAVTVELAFEKAVQSASPLSLRMYMPGPFYSAPKDEALAGFVSDAAGSIYEIPGREEESHAWRDSVLAGVQDKYFVHGLFGATQGAVRRVYFDRKAFSALSAIYELAPVDSDGAIVLNFYLGPKNMKDLMSAHKDLTGLLSFGYLSWICKGMLYLLELIYSFIFSYGWAIVVLTILIKLMFLPIGWFCRREGELLDAFESRYALQISQINQKYSGSYVERSVQLDKFYDSHGISKWGKFMRLLPLLLQVPLFWALYKVLRSYISLHNAPFLWWVKDLSAKDPYFILPILLGVCFLINQRVAKKPKSAGQSPDIKIFNYVMPVASVVLFSFFPAGMLLYLITNYAFTVVEELILQRAFKFE